MVGNALSVVSAGEPFTKIRQEPTKRAAALLNGEQIFQGIRELRRGLDDAQWESKATVILGALRGKTRRGLHGRGQTNLQIVRLAGKPGGFLQGGSARPRT